MVILPVKQSISHLINRITLLLIRWSFNPYRLIKNKQLPPVLVSGIFRSGTSVTTLILSKAGLDVGPEHHLMQSRQNYPHNPDGFKENYFFMELSMYLFKLLGASGDNPPYAHSVDKIDPELLSDEELRSYSLLYIHDDRVSNLNKLRVLRKASVHFIYAYLSNTFGERPVIKNPHFSVLEPFFQKIFPQSLRIVVFRNPQNWLSSARAVTPKADYILYDRYYEAYLASSDARIIFFDYDRLLSHPHESIAVLLDAVGSSKDYLSSLEKLIRHSKPKDSVESLTSFPSTYLKLKGRAINR